jgi:L-threonylcarbamoyladenylate synthase
MAGMHIISLKESDAGSAVAAAVNALKKNGVVLYPTDTLYGLGADALSDEAVDRVYAIKDRDDRKPIHTIVSSLEMAEEYGEIDPLVKLVAENTQKGKVSFIVRKKHGLSTGMCRGIETFGFRIPDHNFCQAMLSTYGRPITATSANIAGEVPERAFDAVCAQLEKGEALPELAIDAGELPESLPSTVVDFSKDRPIIIREGAVPVADIWAAIEQGY